MTRSFKPVKRETAAKSRDHAIIAEMHPGFLVLWEKSHPSTRTAVDYLAIFHLGAKIQAREDAKKQ